MSTNTANLTELLDYDKNTKKFYTVSINLIIKIEDWELPIKAMIDTGCTNTVLNSNNIPERFHNKATHVIQARQMDGTYYTYTQSVKNLQIILPTHGQPYYLPEVNITPHRFDLIIGLDFILTHYNGIILTRQGLDILRNYTLPIASKLREKRGGTMPIQKQKPPLTLHKEKDIDRIIDIAHKKIQQTECYQLEEEQIIQELEEYDEMEISLEILENEKIYNMLETWTYEIDSLMSKLEKLEIFGENLTTHWEKDKTYCKLELLNPNL